MFGKSDPETESRDRRRVEVGAVSGTLAAAIVGSRLRILRCIGPGFPTTTSSIPAPPGKVVALDASSLSALCVDGTVWAWHGEDWLRVGSVMGDAS